MKQSLVLKELWQHCAIRQSDSARDFSSSQDLKSAGILHVFQTFQTVEQVEKIRRSAKAQLCGAALYIPRLKCCVKLKQKNQTQTLWMKTVDTHFFTYAEQTLHTQSLRQPIGIIFTPSGRVYASSPPVMTINKSGSRRFVLPEAFAACTSCLI